MYAVDQALDATHGDTLRYSFEGGSFEGGSHHGCLFQRNRWGHMLPEGKLGKGHNERQVLRALRGSCVAHDASYWLPLQLQGPLTALSAVLVLVAYAPTPTPLNSCLRAQNKTAPLPMPTAVLHR